MQAFFTWLINQVAKVPISLSLVLDDYHVIETTEIHTGLTFLIEHAPDNFHLAIISRTKLPIHLGRLRSLAGLNELNQHDLRFNRDEVAALLTGNAGKPGEALLENLFSQTEGWPAALQLALISLEKTGLHQNEGLGSIKSATPYIFEYLAEEVLNQQSNDVQQFLLASAHLDRFNVSLCAAILQKNETDAVDDLEAEKQARCMLTFLQSANLFLISLDGEENWYRYHHLFSDFLRSKSAFLHDKSIQSIHRKSALWHWENGNSHEAVQSALKSADFDVAGGLVSALAEEMNRRGEVRTLYSWLEQLPPAVLDRYPRLYIWYAHTSSLHLQSGPVEGHLERAENLLQQRQLEGEISADDMQILSAFMAAIRATIANRKGDLQAIEVQALQMRSVLSDPGHELNLVATNFLTEVYLADGKTEKAIAALEQALQETRDRKHWSTVFIAYRKLVESCLLHGSLELAARHIRRAIHLAKSHGVENLLTEILLLSAALNLEHNLLEKGRQKSHQGLKLAQESGKILAECEAHFLLARLDLAEQNLRSAQAEMAEAVSLAERVDERVLSRMLARQAGLAVRTGDIALARRWYKTCRLTEGGSNVVKEEEYLVFGRVLLALGQPRRAARLLKKLYQAARKGQRGSRGIEILLLQAIVDDHLGERAAALAYLEEALSLAEPEGFQRIFLDGGEPIAGLLLESDSSYAKKLAGLFELPVLLEPLSVREQEILRLMEQGLTDRVIGERLHIAFNTVIWHNKNIYRKLGVKNRTQAASRARVLGLE